MNYYEIVVIIHPDLSDEGVENLVKDLEKVVQTHGGEVLQIESWGKKRLTFAIKKLRYGSYVLVRFGATDTTLAELKRFCRYNESVLRDLLVRLKEKPVVTERILRRHVEEAEEESVRGRRPRRMPEEEEEHGPDVEDEEDEEDAGGAGKDRAAEGPRRR